MSKLNLEEAAKKYVASIIYEHGLYDGDFLMPVCEDIFIAGAEWQKQQMIEEAIEGEVYKYDKFSYVKEKKSKSLTELLAKFNDGDKVRIIIVKENEE